MDFIIKKDVVSFRLFVIETKAKTSARRLEITLSLQEKMAKIKYP